MIAEIADSLEKILSGQSGVALGLVMGGALTALGLRLYVAQIGRKLDDSIAAQNRLCRVVANLLISSELQSFQQVGHETIAELNTVEKK